MFSRMLLQYYLVQIILSLHLNWQGSRDLITAAFAWKCNLAQLREQWSRPSANHAGSCYMLILMILNFTLQSV